MKKLMLVLIWTILALFAASHAFSAEGEYVVKKGDELRKIAKKVGVPTMELFKQNKAVIGNNPDLIFPGQRLVFDLKQKGDSSALIAAKQGVNLVNPQQDATAVGVVPKVNAKTSQTKGKIGFTIISIAMGIITLMGAIFLIRGVALSNEPQSKIEANSEMGHGRINYPILQDDNCKATDGQCIFVGKLIDDEEGIDAYFILEGSEILVRVYGRSEFNKLVIARFKEGIENPLNFAVMEAEDQLRVLGVNKEQIKMLNFGEQWELRASLSEII